MAQPPGPGVAVLAARPRCTFPGPGTAVTCAVSGGADSLALLVLAVDAGLVVTAMHVDHGLRPESGAEAEVVAAAAERLGASFRSERVHVGPGPDLEARARRARRDVLPAGALYGHTADDQAETVLLALLRGAGLDGLGGIDPVGHPILDLRRAETEAICTELELRPVQDPSNRDLRFRRNRIRHEVLPLLAEVAERDPVPLLARTARLLRDDAAALDAVAPELDPTDAVGLSETAPAFARRALRAWLRELDPERHPPDASAIGRVLAVACGDAVATEIAGGVEVRRSGQRLHARISKRRG